MKRLTITLLTLLVHSVCSQERDQEIKQVAEKVAIEEVSIEEPVETYDVALHCYPELNFKSRVY